MVAPVTERCPGDPLVLAQAENLSVGSIRVLCLFHAQCAARSVEPFSGGQSVSASLFLRRCCRARVLAVRCLAATRTVSRGLRCRRARRSHGGCVVAVPALHRASRVFRFRVLDGPAVRPVGMCLPGTSSFCFSLERDRSARLVSRGRGSRRLLVHSSTAVLGGRSGGVGTLGVFRHLRSARRRSSPGAARIGVCVSEKCTSLCRGLVRRPTGYFCSLAA